MPRVPFALLLALAVGCTGRSPSAPEVPAAAAAQRITADIPFEQFTLDNGLRVVVHTDRKAPIVAVNIWYHVGGKDEPPGKTGFAHLFEHLMFQASENHPGEYFDPFEQVGATDMNGTTNTDRTNYFQNVPTTALDLALWMESDRMGHLLGAVTPEVLAEQRGVVQNEKRQRENQPYGRVWQAFDEALYPPEHPYYHGVIGSLADLDAASMEDVQSWFKTWYGPNNAVLVLAGDIDAATARPLVERYFGAIAPGPAVKGMEVPFPTRTVSTRAVLTDRVAQTRVYRAWNLPGYGDPDFLRLQLFAQVLGGSRSSRLDKRLVHADKLADSVGAGANDGQLAGSFFLQADVKEGVQAEAVEAAIQDELDRLVAEGPTQEELDQARTVFQASFVRGIERIGGFGGKADVLAECAVYTGDPGCFRDQLQVLAQATVDDVKAAGARWLGAGDHTMVVVPGDKPAEVVDRSTADMPFITKDFQVPPVDPSLKATASTVDRSAGVPVIDTFPDLAFPDLQRATLSNGLKVVLAERRAVPVVRFNLMVDAGYAADTGRLLGTASFTMGMLDEGAGALDALALADRAESLGAQVGASASLDASSVQLYALVANLEPSLDLFGDMVRRPTFGEADIERVRQAWLASIKQEKTRPNSMAFRVLPPQLYGEGHPYAMPLTGSGTEASIASLTRDDLVAFHRDFVRPDNATLLVVGDVDLPQITAQLERVFGDWTAPEQPVPEVSIGEVTRPTGSRVFLIDQPGAIQANVLVGQVMPSIRAPDAVELDMANGVIGGEFTSRLNMNLREDKHWAYGSRSFLIEAQGQRPWIAYAPVQIDKTAESITEMNREIREFATGARPATAAEVDKLQARNVRSLPGGYETGSAVMGALMDIVAYDRPDDWVVQLRARTEAMTDEAVHLASKHLDPDALTWVVVGDLTQIEAPVRALKLGPVQILDADGAPVPQ